MSAMSRVDEDARLREMGERLAELADRNGLLMTQHRADLDTIAQLRQEVTDIQDHNDTLQDMLDTYERTAPEATSEASQPGLELSEGEHEPGVPAAS